MTDTHIPDAAHYGRSLGGLGVSLLVKDLAREINFLELVMQAQVRFKTDRFCALRLNGHDLMLHQDQTYRGNALYGLLQNGEARGLGVELRAYGVDPDAAEKRARAAGFTILSGSLDKEGHGLRECVILDDEGFAWVPSVHLAKSSA